VSTTGWVDIGTRKEVMLISVGLRKKMGKISVKNLFSHNIRFTDVPKVVLYFKNIYLPLYKMHLKNFV
jgi:hypothetical protein